MHVALVASQTGKTAFLAAFEQSHTETAEMLISRGADVTAADNVRHWHAAFAAMFVCACPASWMAIVSSSTGRS